MQRLYDIVLLALVPYVGQMVAETCIRATAISVGKMSDELSSSDLPALDNNVRRLLSPVAPSATISGILEQIHLSVGVAA